MVAGVARGVEGNQCCLSRRQAVAVLEARAGGERWSLAEGADFGGFALGDPRRQRPVVAVGVADQHGRHFPVADGAQDGLEVGVVLFPGVEHEHRAAVTADDVGVRARTGEHARVVLGDPQHAFGQPHGRALQEGVQRRAP